MERKVTKFGGSLGIILGSQDTKIKDIEEGDVIKFYIKEVKKCKKNLKKSKN